MNIKSILIVLIVFIMFVLSSGFVIAGCCYGGPEGCVDVDSSDECLPEEGETWYDGDCSDLEECQEFCCACEDICFPNYQGTETGCENESGCTYVEGECPEYCNIGCCVTACPEAECVPVQMSLCDNIWDARKCSEVPECDWGACCDSYNDCYFTQRYHCEVCIPGTFEGKRVSCSSNPCEGGNGGAAPEFSDYGLVAAVLIIVAIVIAMYMKKKK